MVVFDSSKYIPSIMTPRGSIDADTREYIATFTVLVMEMWN